MFDKSLRVQHDGHPEQRGYAADRRRGLQGRTDIPQRVLRFYTQVRV